MSRVLNGWRNILQADRSPWTRALALVLAATITSRVLYFCLGVRFDASPLDYFIQYIDPQLLRCRLLESVYYLHCQPPLFNLFLGLVLKAFPEGYVAAFHCIYVLFGLVLAVSLFSLAVRLKLSCGLSAAMTILFMVSPACILYENWLFYTYPLAMLLTLAALMLHRFLSQGGRVDGLAFFLLLSSLVLTRSLFHLIGFVFVWGLLLFVSRVPWKRVMAVGSVPFLLVFALYLKNFCVFGTPATSSWLGMNLCRMTVLMVPEKERISLVNQGRLSRCALIYPFSKISDYRGLLPEIPKTGVPVLDNELKSNGHPNRNHIAYIQVSRLYLRDALFVLKANPRAYLRGCVDAVHAFFMPSCDYHFLDKNERFIRPLDRLYDLLVYGRVLPHMDRDASYEGMSRSRLYLLRFLKTGVLLIAAYAMAFLYGLRVARKAFSKEPFESAYALTVLFMWLTILYVAVVGNALENGENNRFRFMIDPYALTLLMLFLGSRFSRLLAQPAAGGAPSFCPKGLIASSCTRRIL